MAYFDMDKNSLPEQVQENKEKIKDLETNAATTTYVDDKDADTLQAAKDYADGKDTTTLQAAKDYADQQKVPKSALHAKGSMIYGSDVYTPANLNIGNTGDVLKVSADGIPEWQTPAKVKAADIDSESETAGKVLVSDGAGGAAWGNAGGGSILNLIWSGSLSVTPSGISTPSSMLSALQNNKMYMAKYFCNSHNFALSGIGTFNNSYNDVPLGLSGTNSSNSRACFGNIIISNVNIKVTAWECNNATLTQVPNLTFVELYEVTL